MIGLALVDSRDSGQVWSASEAIVGVERMDEMKLPTSVPVIGMSAVALLLTLPARVTNKNARAGNSTGSFLGRSYKRKKHRCLRRVTAS